MTQQKYSKKHKCQSVKINATYGGRKKKFIGIATRSDGVLKTIDEKEQLS